MLWKRTNCWLRYGFPTLFLSRIPNQKPLRWVKEGRIPETQPLEQLSAQYSTWQVMSWGQPGHSGTLLPTGSKTRLPIPSRNPMELHAIKSGIPMPFCGRDVIFCHLGDSVHLQYTTTVVTEWSLCSLKPLGTGAAGFCSYERPYLHRLQLRLSSRSKSKKPSCSTVHSGVKQSCNSVPHRQGFFCICWAFKKWVCAPWQLV